MADQNPDAEPQRLQTRSGVLAAGVLAATALMLVGWPLLSVVRLVERAIDHDPALVAQQLRSMMSPLVFVLTGTYALLIAACAVLLALPAARLMASHGTGPERARRVAFMSGPLLLPSYLCYAGWGLLRGPNTWLGDHLARLDPAWSVFAGKLTALAGLALWVWPLAALFLAVGLSRVGRSASDLIRLDTRSPLRRLWVGAVQLRSSLFMALLAVALVMGGSVIPLHVAQVPTYAIELWKAMQLTPEAGGLWIAASPVAVIALAAAWVLGRAVTSPAPWTEQLDSAAEAGRAVRLGTWLVWAASVAVPFLLFAWSLNAWRSIPMFWRISGGAVMQSAAVGAAAGACGVGLTLAMWLALDGGGVRGRRVARLAMVAMAWEGFMPGVLVGQAFSQSAPASLVGVVATHVARFGWVALLAGCWLARQEPAEQRWLRQVERGSGLRIFLTAAVLPRSGVIAGIGLAIALLSLHEIESTVFVLPPGADNLAQQLLDYLHYARDEQLSAAAMNLMLLGFVGAWVSAWLVARGSRLAGSRMGAATPPGSIGSL